MSAPLSDQFVLPPAVGAALAGSAGASSAAATAADTARVFLVMQEDSGPGYAAGSAYFSTLTARAKTSARVDIDTSACTVIISLAHRDTGMVSVGENATTLVKLT